MATSAYPIASSYGFSGDPNESDINKAWRQNRQYALGQGQSIDSYLAGEQNYYNGLASGYRSQADTAYGDLAATPGYTDAEASQIVRDPQFNSLVTPQSKLDSLAPTDAEASAIRGDTGSYGDYFDPALMRQVNANSATLQRNAVTNTQAGLTGTIGNQAKALNDIASGAQLGLSDDFYTNSSGALNNGNSKIDSYIDPSKLTYSDADLNNLKISDQDVQDWQTQAANTVRNSAAAAKDDLTRSAAASGNADALAVAAGRARLENQSEVNAADAMTNARIQGRAAQLQQNAGVEQMGMGAQQSLANLGTTNAQAETARNVGQANTTEQMRQEGEQARVNLGVSNANTIASNAIQAGEYSGNLQTGVESGIGATEANTEQNIAGMGTGIRQAQDTANSSRAGQLYGARTGAAQYGIDTGFGQGMAVNTQLSNANTQVANARIGGQQEYRGYLTGQTNNTMQAGQTNSAQRIANYGATTGATNQATSGLSGWEIGNQGNTVLNKSMNMVGTLTGAANSAANMKRSGMY